MKLDPIIQSEVSQKEKDKYCIYMEFRKTVPIILHAVQQRRHIGRTGFWTQWEKARVG